MYEPALFRVEDEQALRELIRARPLGLLIAPGGDFFASADLIPFLLDEKARMLRAHVARTNPLVAALAAPCEVLVVFSGGEAYVTPSYYPSKQAHGRVVPTWNYVMVQARGVARLRLEPEWLDDQIEKLTDGQEGLRAKPWAVGDAPDDFIAAQKRAVIGLEVEISDWRGKFKLSQNRSAEDRRGVIDGLAAETSPEARALAQFMSAREAP
jgi:transcriptional regulator